MKQQDETMGRTEAGGENRAVLVGVLPDADAAEEMELAFAELSRLCETAGLSVAAVLSQVRDRPNAATCIGKGKLEELDELCRAQEASIVVFDYDLTPSQIKNIEDAITGEVRVIDRTMLILDIFAQNATTGEGMLQVEIAQLKYNVPRLSGKGKALSRLGGGIGTRGPGESKLETDRRHVRRKIAALEKRLEALSASRGLRRDARKRGGVPQVTIAGYTNAGKSTLLNYLTHAGILAEDKLFATLDPTTRRLKVEGAGEVLLTDTVGFIDRLPHHLIEAFASTLDEVAYADLLLVVLDATEEALERHLEVTNSLLAQLYESRGVSAVPTIFVYNKCDLIAPEALRPIAGMRAQKNVFVSAKTGMGIEDLLHAVARELSQNRRRIRLRLSPGREDLLDLLYRQAAIEKVEYSEEGIEVIAYADEKTRGQVRESIIEEYV